MPAIKERIGAVAIGRNEGERLRACLQSLQHQLEHIVYVDSGSTDDSMEIAEELGVTIVELDLDRPFTAARARNVGYRRLAEIAPQIEYVQFIDGDCTLVDGWIDAAFKTLEEKPEVFVVCGRRRERFPEQSLYNRLCDIEWNLPVGPVRTCGGDSLMRRVEFDAVEGFDPTVIAGEEPELCYRLRHRGGTVLRIDQEMTLHDAAISRFGQWWRRSKRTGYAMSIAVVRYGREPERFFVREVMRSLFWTMVVPIAIPAVAFLLTPWALLGFAVYPLQIVRLALRNGRSERDSWRHAILYLLSCFAHVTGMMQFLGDHVRGVDKQIIEYK